MRWNDDSPDQDDIWCNDFLNTDVFRQIESGRDIVAFSYYCTNSDFTHGRKVQVQPKTIGGGYEAASGCWSHHSSMFLAENFCLVKKLNML